jgi:hypothetical protein
MSNFNLQTSHPLIKSEQTFVLDRKVISIHSIDRDYAKWPNSNHFGIDLGEAFHNVQSLRLINYSIPTNNYTFSTSYQNTKISFTYKTDVIFNFANLADFNGITVRQYIDKTLNVTFGFPAGTTSSFNQWFLSQNNRDMKVSYLNTNNIYIDALTNADGNWSNADTINGYMVKVTWTPNPFQITIPEGLYTANDLAKTVETLMNKEVFNLSADLNHNCFPILQSNVDNHNADTSFLPVSNNGALFYRNPQNVAGWGLKPFVVYYDKVSNKIKIGCNEGNFSLMSNNQEIYDPECDVNKAIFHQYTKWGLPAYLGFNKKLYNGNITDISNSDFYTKSKGGLFVNDSNSTIWITPNGIKTIKISDTNDTQPNWNKISVTKYNTNVCSMSAENNLDIGGEDAMYIEIDRYNNIDEIYPYSERTGHLYNNDLGHRVNGSFAKIALPTNNFTQSSGTRNNMVLNIFHSDPPIQRIDRLKIKFRYHDGRLVDFKNLPTSLTLELNMLKDEQTRGKRVRVPHLYNL